MRESTPRLRPTGKRQVTLFFALIIGVIVLAILGLTLGSVNIPLTEIWKISTGYSTTNTSWQTIVIDIRVPRTFTALLAGAGIGLAGLQMQTLFRNPLADPFVLGISSGASLGVALIVLTVGSAGAVFGAGLGLFENLSLAIAAIIGSTVVLFIVLLIAERVRSAVTILIVGLMVGYLVSAIVMLLVAWSEPQQLSRFVVWGCGSFRSVPWDELRILAPVSLLGFLIAGSIVKPLNALLLGEDYAKSLGINIRTLRIMTLTGSSLLAGIVTAFCGPIAFIGVATPHIARSLFKTSDHRILVPAVILSGAIIAMIAELVAHLPGNNSVLPLNAVTSLLGAPVVVIVLIRSRLGAFTG